VGNLLRRLTGDVSLSHTGDFVSALQLAASGGMMPLVQQLLDRNVLVDTKGGGGLL
jgi:hypothetical protein